MHRRLLCWCSLFIAGLVGLCAAETTQAQVNTERLRVLDANGFAASFGGELALRTGNTERVELGLESRIDYRVERHYTFLVGRLRYETSEGRAVENQSFGHLRYNYQVRGRLVAEGFGQAERDAFTLLQLRLLAGAGLRFRHVHRTKGGIYQGTALMIEYENLEVDAVQAHSARTIVGRWSNYLNVQVRLTDQTSFINTVYIQPRLDAFGDYRLLNDAVLAVALSKHFTLTATFNLRYDNRPPREVGPLDIALRNGLTVTFR